MSTTTIISCDQRAIAKGENVPIDRLPGSKWLANVFHLMTAAVAIIFSPVMWMLADEKDAQDSNIFNLDNNFSSFLDSHFSPLFSVQLIICVHLPFSWIHSFTPAIISVQLICALCWRLLFRQSILFNKTVDRL